MIVCLIDVSFFRAAGEALGIGDDHSAIVVILYLNELIQEMKGRVIKFPFNQGFRCIAVIMMGTVVLARRVEFTETPCNADSKLAANPAQQRRRRAQCAILDVDQHLRTNGQHIRQFADPDIQ